jgi:hypothetical protein
VIVKRGAGDHTTGMSTLLEIESAINELSLAELADLERLVRDELRERRNVKMADATASPRVLGLHEGAWSVADDFDTPLPEEFWLGNDA